MDFPTIVILEDDENRIAQFRKKLKDKATLHVFNNVSECDSFMRKNSTNIDMFFLDHDLDHRIFVNSKEENTGYSMAKKIKEVYGEDYPDTIIHSLNPVGAENILSILTESRRIPFTRLISSIWLTKKI